MFTSAMVNEPISKTVNFTLMTQNSFLTLVLVLIVNKKKKKEGGKEDTR